VSACSFWHFDSAKTRVEEGSGSSATETLAVCVGTGAFYIILRYAAAEATATLETL